MVVVLTVCEIRTLLVRVQYPIKIYSTGYEISSSSSLGDVVPSSPSGMNFDYDLEEVPQYKVPKLVRTNP